MGEVGTLLTTVDRIPKHMLVISFSDELYS